MQIGFLGLGKMGTRIVEKLLKDGHDVIGWNRTYSIAEEFLAIVQNPEFRAKNPDCGTLQIKKTLSEVVEELSERKILWLMLPAGEATETVLQEIVPSLHRDHIVIDGGNAFFRDTERRFAELKEKQIRFLGVGVSGGVIAEKTGYPFMIGGDKSAYDEIVPLLDSLSKPNGGHTYFGEGGAGHFVKMVHNGVEYGMMQAIGEGFGVLEKAPYTIDLLEVARIWQKGTIVDSFLIDRAGEALEKNVRLDDIEGVIDATGEAEWTVTQGKEEGVPVENIEQSLDFRRRSKSDVSISSSFAARMVAALRREFGGHAVKKKN